MQTVPNAAHNRLEHAASDGSAGDVVEQRVVGDGARNANSGGETQARDNACTLARPPAAPVAARAVNSCVRGDVGAADADRRARGQRGVMIEAQKRQWWRVYSTDVKKARNRGLYKAVQNSNGDRMTMAELTHAIQSGRNICLCAPAGHGKTQLVRDHIVRTLHAKYGVTQEDEEKSTAPRVWITSSTAISAQAIDGDTIHAMGGFGRFEGSDAGIAERILTSQVMSLRWLNAKAVLIEEGGMISGDAFDKAEAVARIVRGREEYFGGLQVIFVGDFCQLPPISDIVRVEHGDDEYAETEVTYAFQARRWNAASWEYVTLLKCWRQLHAAPAGGEGMGEINGAVAVDDDAEDLLLPLLCIVRTCTGDTLPDAVREALSLARHVTWTKEENDSATNLLPKKHQVRSFNLEKTPREGRERFAAVDR